MPSDQCPGTRAFGGPRKSPCVVLISILMRVYAGLTLWIAIHFVKILSH